MDAGVTGTRTIDWTDRRDPQRGSDMGNSKGAFTRRIVTAVLVFGALISCASAAHAEEGISVVYQFKSTEGDPSGRAVLGPDGNLYGTTTYGGTNDRGTIYKVTPPGAYTRLVDFDGANGAYPSSIILGGDGNFYGTTSGFSFPQTVFRLTSNGVLTTLHAFSGTDGLSSGSLMRSREGTIYGIGGKVYRIDASRLFSVVRDLVPSYGAAANAITGTDGAIYGTGYASGASQGSVFRFVPPAGSVEILHDFSGARIQSLAPGVAEGKDGYLWGCTSGSDGGDSVHATVYRVRPDGSGFETVKDLGYASYCYAPLLRAGDDLYGSFVIEEFSSKIVRIKPDGTFVTLSDAEVAGGFTQAPDGTLYGTASYPNAIIRLHRPTDLFPKADYTVAPLAGKVTFNPQATLSDAVTHAGVAGRKIYFTTNTGTAICAAYTDVTGFAKCQATLLGHVNEMTGVTAHFFDDGTYGATSARAPLSCAGTVCTPFFSQVAGK
jgi:uncharacterized repeat protein (TIGR03803 family)